MSIEVLESIVAMAYGGEPANFSLEDFAALGLCDDLFCGGDIDGFFPVHLCALHKHLTDARCRERLGLGEDEPLTDTDRRTYISALAREALEDPVLGDAPYVGALKLRDSRGRSAFAAFEINELGLAIMDAVGAGAYRSEQELREQYRRWGHLIDEADVEGCATVLLARWKRSARGEASSAEGLSLFPRVQCSA